MRIGDVVEACGLEVEKIRDDAWLVRGGVTGLAVVSTYPDGKFVGVPWAVHAVKCAEQRADEIEAFQAAFQAANRAAGLIPF